MPPTLIRIGTAGWTIPKPHATGFPPDGTHLQRYAQRFLAVEINSSFYRAHKPATYARWAASVPPAFRFAVKLPREITHTRKLIDIAGPLDRFLSEVTALGDRLGPLLIQLPPSLAFDPTIAGAFFDTFRARFESLAVCEPRNPSWFTNPAEALLRRFQIARAAADPAPVPRATVPGGHPKFAYHRLHGSPRIYYSQYDPIRLDAIATVLTSAAQEYWCIFDNTALGHATSDALALIQRLAV